MNANFKMVIAALSASALLGMGSSIAVAQEHTHAHADADSAKLSLHDGKKWETDDKLHQSMSRIRDALAAELPAIHSGKATAEQYRALAQKVRHEIEYMLDNCKLEPEADAMFHRLLGEIIAGTDAMAENDIGEASAGAGKIARALGDYPLYFSHPGWIGLSASH